MNNTFISDLSKNEFSTDERIAASAIPNSIFQLIRKEHPSFTKKKCLASSELNVYRQKYIANFLANEVGELSQLEETVLSALQNKNTLADKIADTEPKLSIGQKLADGVASFGGSWTFIICFGIFMFAWIGLNVYFLKDKGFDPFPFILLNLILSCLAAMQAPVIMMSQNRQEEKDRDRAKKDYMINLKSELEIRMLHEKLDHLIMHQQHELIEMQKMQIEMMDEILKKVGSSRTT